MPPDNLLSLSCIGFGFLQVISKVLCPAYTISITAIAAQVPFYRLHIGILVTLIYVPFIVNWAPEQHEDFSLLSSNSRFVFM